MKEQCENLISKLEMKMALVGFTREMDSHIEELRLAIRVDSNLYRLDGSKRKTAHELIGEAISDAEETLKGWDNGLFR